MPAAILDQAVPQSSGRRAAFVALAAGAVAMGISPVFVRLADDLVPIFAKRVLARRAGAAGTMGVGSARGAQAVAKGASFSLAILLGRAGRLL